jgi:hypothetical protein
MAKKPGQMPAEYVIDTDWLFARSGFRGGDLLREAFPNLGAAELRALLVDVVHEHVLPKLDQKVWTLQIPTVHNPVRATSVDNVPVKWNAERGAGPRITPASVRVKAADVIACARRRRIDVSDQEG